MTETLRIAALNEGRPAFNANLDISFTASAGSLLERSSVGRADLSPAAHLVDRIVGASLENISRPSSLALMLGGVSLLRASRAGLALMETRAAFAAEASLFQSPMIRGVFASLGFFALGCGSGESSSVGGEGGVPNSTPPPAEDAGPPDTPPESPPYFGSPQSQGSVPCGAGSMISDLDLDSTGGLGVCANYTTNNHHLFRWDPASSGSGSVSSIIPLSFAPDQVLRLGSGEIVISTHQNPGLSLVNETEGSESHAAFPTVTTTRLSSSGRNVPSFQPRSPKGMVELSGRVFVTTSNYDEAAQDYLPGTVLSYNRGSGAFDVIHTGAYNPTSVTPILYQGQMRLLVVESGAISREGNALTESRLEIYDPTTRNLLFPLPLGNVAAGISGEVAVSPDGRRVVLPTGNNSGQLLVVDLEASSLRSMNLRDRGLSSDQVLLTGSQLSSDGRYAFVGNFNDGRMYAIDLDQPGASPTPVVLDSNVLDGEGVSDFLRRGRDLFIGVGPRIYKVAY